jgi:hypothetical protein
MPVRKRSERRSAREAVPLNVKSVKIEFITDPEFERKLDDEFELVSGKKSLWRWFKKLFR